MGTFRVAIRVGGIDKEAERVERVHVLVDTGALHSMLPASLLDHLGIMPQWKQLFSLADLSIAEYPVGYAMFYINDKERACPTIFGPENDYLLGATTLENFSLSADPVNEILVDVIHHARPV